ncbi:DUF2637 domain-containing protein [Streptomyces sp. NPDC001262]|uniref:DUF2637 domain-containing protein n=1 Tax=Streptomyces sp. NPDC001262 TaxID=3364552 RepID=UPI003674139F
MTTPENSDVRRDWMLDAGMSAVGLAAAASSYAALQDLALRTGWWPWLSWLLPLTVDAYAMTAVRVWLGRSTRNTYARTWAKYNAVGGIALSVAGNAVDHAAAAKVLVVSWPLIVAVSAIPPVVLGLLVHMAHLRNQPPASALTPNTLAADGTPAETAGEAPPATPPQQPADETGAAAPPPASVEPRAPREVPQPRSHRRRAVPGTRQRVLPPGKSDEELIDAARLRMADGGEVSATWLIKTYGIGTGRAGRIRDAVTRVAQPAPELTAVLDEPGPQRIHLPVPESAEPDETPDHHDSTDPDKEPRSMTTDAPQHTPHPDDHDQDIDDTVKEEAA